MTTIFQTMFLKSLREATQTPPLVNVTKRVGTQYYTKCMKSSSFRAKRRAHAAFLVAKEASRLKLHKPLSRSASQQSTSIVCSTPEQTTKATPTQQVYTVQSLDYISRIFSGRTNITFDSNFVIKLMEDIGVLAFQLIRATDNADYAMAVTIFVKLRTSESVLVSMFSTRLMTRFRKLFGADMETQGAEEIFADCRSYLDKYDEVKNSPIFKKLYKFMMYALSLSFFDKIGLSMSDLNFSEIEQEAMKRKYHKGVDFVHTLLDTFVFICERGYQCVKQGSMDPIFHSGSTYQAWYTETTELRRMSVLLSNPGPHGFKKCEYITRLRDAVEKGDAIYKHAVRLGEFEKRLVSTVLNDMKMLLAMDITKRDAQRDRKAPFAVLLNGGTSIGKSTLSKLLFYQYGKVFGLPITSEYRYTRNPCSEFWDGFNSAQWCVQLDDIAFMHPNKAASGDPSVMEMLQVVNNISFVPNQADLADKGKTPMLAELVIATTNCADLNAVHYFQTPLAVRRRFPFVVTAKPKPEFARAVIMLDSSKVHFAEGEWPDYWDFHVQKVIPVNEKHGCNRGNFVDVANFTNINDFLAWYSREAKEHESVQDKVKDCDTSMSSLVVCQKCFYLEKLCKCAATQADDEEFKSEEEDAYDFVQEYDDEGNARYIVLEDIRYDRLVRNDQARYENHLQDYLRRAEETRKENLRNNPLNQSKPPTWREVIMAFLFTKLVLILGTRPMMYLMNQAFMNHLVLPRLRYLFMGPEHRQKELAHHFEVLGEKVQRKFFWCAAVYEIMTLIAAYMVVAKATSLFIGMLVKPKLATQGNGASISKDIGSAPKPTGDEKPNVWFNDSFELTNFDVSPTTTSYLGVDQAQVAKWIAGNCIHIRSKRTSGDTVRERVIRATCVSGHIYVCNNHGLPVADKHESRLTLCSSVSGVSSNADVIITENDIWRIPERDIAFVRIRAIPPRKDISQLFAKTQLRGVLKGAYIGRCEDGSIFRREVEALRYNPLLEHSDHLIDFKAPVWDGHVSMPTQLGDCGSILLATTGLGPVLLGLHFMGGGDKVRLTPVTASDVETAMVYFNGPHINCGAPKLSSQSAVRVLGDLSHRSTLRYFEKGTANVYGSFAGFRPSSKSSVVKTVICDSMLRRGFEIGHGPPVMRGWQPWRTAVADMIQPVTRIRSDVLEDCVASYTDDILSGLSEDDLREIMVYDDLTTLNGAPGVAYVDKINRHTSAGNPWKKSKKYFLEAIPAVGELLEPVEASDEVMDRVSSIIEGYHNGNRYMPNFCGHLKDEATTFAKIEKSKTRVFTGAPFDWSIVVRKYLLSTVRVIQKNRYLFEAAPGTNCQSYEWQELYEYLTQHGTERMVAGDYGAFDKTMPPTVILAAFDILKAMCKKAGYSQDDLNVVQGIAEDTAFPLVDFNGDLIEFFGSNPSGHPLTVIINSLANSLYMRYCYAILSNERTCKNFKRDVSLMTYGDDNVMGVSPSAEFFNHTAIQKVLADVGIRYTMADKESASVPYIPISDVSFLKRTFRWDNFLGVHLSPLEEASIIKSLTMIVQSKTITPEYQAVCVMSAACNEYFFYGEKVFERKRRMLLEIIRENGLEAYVERSTFPTYQQLVERFRSTRS